MRNGLLAVGYLLLGRQPEVASAAPGRGRRPERGRHRLLPRILNLVIEVAGEASGVVVIDLLPEVAPLHVERSSRSPAKAPTTASCSTG
jgi:hypothetical protein